MQRINMYIGSKLQGLEEQQAKFRHIPNLVNRATASALNKLGALAVTETNKTIRDTYNIKAGDVSKAIKKTPAKASWGGKGPRLFTVMTVSGGRLGLHKFGGLPATPAPQRGVPVSKRKAPTVKIYKTQARRKVYPGNLSGNAAFVARMVRGFGGSETNHVGIFYRLNKRLPGRWRPGQTPGGKGQHQVIRELKAKGLAEIFLGHARSTVDTMLAVRGPAMLKKEADHYVSISKKIAS